MAFKIKQESIAPELGYARSKLEEALQFIADKTDDSPSTSDDEYNKCGTEMMIKREPSPVASPSKRPIQRSQRKRRRKDETLNKNANSYVMKLFDRAVDLTPFNESTPLYPVCRAWINNQDLYKSSAVEPKEEQIADDTESTDEERKNTEVENSDDVTQMPPHIPKGDRELRLPSPIPKDPEEFVICSDEKYAESKSVLLDKHLTRWKAIRQKWRQACKTNEERYQRSAMVLQAIYDRAQNGNEDATRMQM